MTNTIDILTDDVAFKQLVEKTITEFIDDSIDLIGTYSFSYCPKLTNVECINVTYLQPSAFANSNNLISAILPKLETVSDYAFSECTSLKNIDYPLLTEVRYRSFFNCNKLETVNLPKVKKIGEFVFQYCAKLTELNFPMLNEINSYAFANCDALKNLYVGTSVNTVCILTNINAIPDTIENIYVPMSLVEEYKTATNWINFADKIKGV